jgi:hypothetical protein
VKGKGTAMYMNKSTIKKSGAYPISYTNSRAWEIPSKFPINYAHEPMCRIQLTINSDWIDTSDSSEGGGALKKSITMKASDQYNWTTTLGHFHKESNNEYCAFRY